MTPFPSPEHRAPRILVISSGSVGARAASLLASDAQVTQTSALEALPTVEGFDAVAFATDHPLPKLERCLDLNCWRFGVAWVSALVIAHEFRVGPLIVPGETACHACFERRRRALVPELEIDGAIAARAAQGDATPWFAGEFEALTEQVAAILAAETLALARHEQVLPGRHLARYWEGNALFGALRPGLCAGVAGCEVCVDLPRQCSSYAALAGELGAGRSAPLEATR